MSKILKLAITDFNLIFRDSSLRSFFFLPIIIFAFIIWVVPYLVETYDFLLPYLPVFLAVAVIENTQMFCFISTMVLIDEKETDVAKVYGVVPLTKEAYIFSRFLIPYFFTVFLNIAMLLAQPFYVIPFGIVILISCLAALVVPVYVLAINSIVQNRMQGMVYVKAFNMLVLIPLAVFFVPENIRHLFGIFPTHWLYQSIDYAVQGFSAIYVLVIGFAYFTILFWFISRLFVKKHFV